MSLPEKKKTIEYILKHLNENYEKAAINISNCYSYNSIVFRVSEFPGENALVLEYMDEYGSFEDSDVLYLDDYNSQLGLFEQLQKIIKA